MPAARSLILAVPALVAAHAAAQSVLYGVASNGDFVRIDKATGVGTLIGNSGVGANGAAADSHGRVFSGGGNADQIIRIDPATGAGSVFLTTTGRPGGYGIRGMAFDPSDRLYVVLSQADTSAIDTLATIDMASGAYTVIGPTARTDIQALACSPAGVLYAIGVNFNGRLYTLDATTGAATTIGG